MHARTSPTIRGLTLWRPWAAAIVLGPKRIENRPWHPPLRLLDAGLWIAIHAGRRWDGDAANDIADLWPAARVELRQQPLPFEDERAWPRPFVEQGIVGVARVVRAEVFDALRDDGATGIAWAFGPWCWVLDDVRALAAPIPIRGAQGLWPLPPDVLAVLEPLCRTLPPDFRAALDPRPRCVP